MRHAWLVLALVGCTASNAGVDASTFVNVDRGVLDATPDFGPAPDHDAAVGDLAGDHWDGTFDGDVFASGSHRIQIIFDHADEDGARTGVVVFGMARAPAPPTDPSVGYPPGFGFDSLGMTALSEGFVYPIIEGSVQGTHIHVVLNQLGLWEPWCELQTPVFSAPPGDGWGCLPLGGTTGNGQDCIYEPADGPWFPLDCGRALLCQPPGFCECTADGCTARMRQPVTIELDVTGTSATGTVWSCGNAQLTRM